MGNRGMLVKTIIFIIIWVLNLPQSLYCTFTREFLCSRSVYPSGMFIGWESSAQKRAYIKKGLYEPKNMLPTRFQIVNDSLFVVIPRFRCGVPFTLGLLNLNDYCKAEPLMYPYPCWGANAHPDGMIHNAVDLFIDTNFILWVLDVGVVNTLTTPKFIKPPRVLGVNLLSGSMAYNLNLLELVNNSSRLQYIQVEIADRKSYVYISDAGTNSIIVWHVDINRTFKVLLPRVLQKDCNQADVLYLYLIKTRLGKSSLYVTYLNSQLLYHIPTHLLREGKSEGVVEEDGMKPGRIVLLGTDQMETLFFRLRGSPDIFLWNSVEEFRLENFFLAENVESGRLPTHVTVGSNGLIWSLESNFPDFLSEQIGSVGPSTKVHPIVKFCNEESANCSSITL